MKIHETALQGVYVIEPKVYGDHRGFFKETWQRDRYEDNRLGADFVQDNISRSVRGTLRGLHYQMEQTQGKLVQAIAGKIFDVAVDMRRSSPTFGKWHGEFLSSENHKQLYVPTGFAHGFCVISDSAEVFYKCTDFYHPESERTLLWNDPELGIEWPLAEMKVDPILSEKDAHGIPFAQADSFA
jgi:dTDP-4-dehydrorhamnose 3,5-epimerase